MSQDQIIDCGVIIALEEELACFFKHFQPGEARFGRYQEVYYPFEFLDSRGERRRGIVTLLADVGLEPAAIRAERFLSQFQIELLVNIGIAGSLSSDAVLGDVVVAATVDHYGHRAKVTAADTSQVAKRWGGDSLSTDTTLSEHASQFRFSRPREFSEWKEHARTRISTELEQSELQLLRTQKILRESPELRAKSAIASGDSVATSSEFRNDLLRRNRNFVVIEMEAHGILAASLQHSPKPRTLVIKGVSDLSDDRKSALDTMHSGALRRYAMENAVTFFLKLNETFQLFEHDATQGSQAQSGDMQRAALESRINQLATDVYFAPEHRRYMELTEFSRALPSVSTFLSAFLSDSYYRELGSDMLLSLARRIANSTSRNPLRVEGVPGTGKSVFLIWLYLALYHSRVPGSALPLPVYINLHHYDWTHFVGKIDNEHLASADCARDLAPVVDYCRAFPDSAVIFIVDGIDEYIHPERAVESQVLRLVAEVRRHKIIGLGLTDDPEEPSLRRAVHHLGRFELTIKLIPKRTEDQDLFAVVEALAVLLGRRAFVAKVLSTIEEFGLKTVDTLILSLLLDGPRILEEQRVDGFGAFLEQYCEELLRTRLNMGSAPITVGDVAAVAYAFYIAKTVAPGPDLYRDPRWKLLQRHPSIRHYMIARHVIETIRIIGRGESADYEVAGHVYPHDINRFQKEIMNASQGSQKAVLDGLKIVFEKGSKNCRAHACYLAGRFVDPKFQAAARASLSEWKRVVGEEVEKSSKVHRKTLLLLRSIYISLVELGDRVTGTEYIKRLLRDHTWDNLNRGFHLEYYGDIVFNSGVEKEMIHEDNLGECRETVMYLQSKILRMMQGDAQGYPLLEIEYYTVLSLAQHRHIAGRLPEELRQASLNLIRSLSNRRAMVSPLLQRYSELVARHLTIERFRAGSILDSLLRLKETKRRGWVARGISGGESVADHVFGCYLLALIYLPDIIPSLPKYKKATILQMLLVHELAEAEIGDLLPQEKGEEQRRLEEREIEMLSMIVSYEGVYGPKRLDELWSAMKGNDINGKIAGELDKLENLVQLYRYRRQGLAIPDFELWESGLVERVKTEPGLQVLRVVQEEYADVASLGQR